MSGKTLSRGVGVSEFANILGVTTPTSSLLQEIQQRSGLSQAELARRAGLPRSVINTYLRGHREAGADAVFRIAAAGGFELRLAPRTPPVDTKRAGRRLAQVLDLAEALPFRRARKLRYPKLPVPAASRRRNR
jgi:transcriptional regulator with XRE-family HTH domain